MWNLACDKAGLGIRDKATDRRVYCHHSLRKFFRSKIGLDLDARAHTHALMGHTQYLDSAYLRLEQEGEIAKAYLEARPNCARARKRHNRAVETSGFCPRCRRG